MIKLITSTFLVSILFLGCAQKPEERQIQKKADKLSIELEGTSYPYKSQTITSINGKVAKLHKNVGDYVKKGDVIFSIDEKIIKKQIEQLELEIKNAERNLRSYRRAYNSNGNPTIIHLARLNLEKVAKLYAKGYVSEEKYNQAKNDYALALFNDNERKNNNTANYHEREREISEKKVELFKLQDQLNYTKVKANMEGYISRLNLYEGKVLAEGENIGDIVNISKIHVKAGLAPGLLPFVKKNKVVKVTFLTTPSIIVDVPIKKVVPIMDPEFGRILVEFEVSNENNIIQSGTKALVSIELSDEDKEKVNYIFNNGEKSNLSIKSEN